MIAPLSERYLPATQAALRIAAGTTFFSHGAQKMFGWFGGFGPDGGTAELMSRFGAAGIIEVVAGFCILIGLWTRLMAFTASGEMAVTYFWMHVSRTGNLWWWENRGEVVLLYAFIFLVFAAWGAGPASVDAQLAARKRSTEG